MEKRQTINGYISDHETGYNIKLHRQISNNFIKEKMTTPCTRYIARLSAGW